MTLRVLMTADTAGGVWTYALSLCRALSSADVRVRLLALGQPASEQREAAAAISNIEMVPCPVRLEWMEEPWEDLDRLEPELMRQAAKTGCALVHLNHLVHGHLPWGRPVLCGVHSCVQSWYSSVRGRGAPREWRVYHRRVARSLQSADHVVAPSLWMLQRAQSLYGPFNGRSIMVNGSDAPLGDPAASREGVLAAGRVWDDAKNLMPLAHLAKELSATVHIAGPGSVQRLEQSAAIGLGQLDQESLWRLMRRTSVFAAPALYEPFGLGILEAARSGCALVLGDIPSLRELWSGAAAFVDPRRPDDWKDTIETLLRDDEMRMQLANAAQRQAERFTLNRMARDCHRLYERLLSTEARKAS